MVQDDGTGVEQVAYEPPAIERLGTLGELTKGGGGGGIDFTLTGSFT